MGWQLFGARGWGSALAEAALAWVGAPVAFIDVEGFDKPGPQRDRLLLPIFTKPLRALPFGMQIGHIDAVRYTLQLPRPLPAFNEELFRVLTEALALHAPFAA